MRGVFAAALALWLSVVALSLFWGIRDDDAQEERLALETARTLMTQVSIAREWNAKLGGVYTLVTPENQPNPYLSDRERDVTLPDGRVLTKINPAYMTRQLADLSTNQTRFRFRITSLDPLRPANAPTRWEESALKRLELGDPEVAEYRTEGDRKTFIYMAPLHASKECLRCHEKQGVKEGDLRGGISIEIADPPELPATSIILWHALFALLGALFIVHVGKKLEGAYSICRYDATIDPLTRIPNRRFFMERYHHELRVAHRQEEPMGLIMVDVDHFKNYNDTYGHLEGDRCLIAVAKAISDSLQRPQDLCGRFGGEEFIVMLPATSERGALFVAERIRASVQSLMIAHKTSSAADHVTVSVGLAILGPGAASPDVDLKFISMADQALYEAKNGGRNRVAMHR